MYWQEEVNEQQFIVPDRVINLLFRIDCPTLPVDHAWGLSREIQRVLPWFGEEPTEGLHIIHGADSGNGWERPQASDDLLYLSRRVKLVLRLPRARVVGSLVPPAPRPTRISVVSSDSGISG